MLSNKVLFVTSNRIGDCVISSGIIREIARQIPGAQITVACGRPPAPFFRSAPGVERVIPLDKKKAAGHWLDLWRQVVGTHWALVIDIRGSYLSREQRKQADFLIEPPVGDIGMFEDHRIVEAIEKGVITASSRLEAAKESLILSSIPKLTGGWAPGGRR